MTRIVTRRRSAPDVGLMRSRVIVCTTIERPDGDVSTIVKRPGVIEVMARVAPMRADQILNWKAVLPSVKTPSHEITIRTPPDVKIDLNHWVYCRDRYAETWYRVQMVEDLGNAKRFTLMLCTIETIKDARSDPVTQPLPPVWENPTDDVRDAV